MNVFPFDCSSLFTGKEFQIVCVCLVIYWFCLVSELELSCSLFVGKLRQVSEVSVVVNLLFQHQI